MLVTPVTLSIPLWRRIRNSGVDPTTIFGDSPVAFSTPFPSLFLSFTSISLPFPPSLPPHLYTPPVPYLSLSFSLSSAILPMPGDLFLPPVCLYNVPYTVSWYGLTDTNPPATLLASFLFSAKRFHGRSFCGFTPVGLLVLPHPLFLLPAQRTPPLPPPPVAFCIDD